jgi:hypothetical protein
MDAGRDSSEPEHLGRGQLLSEHRRDAKQHRNSVLILLVLSAIGLLGCYGAVSLWGEPVRGGDFRPARGAWLWDWLSPEGRRWVLTFGATVLVGLGLFAAWGLWRLTFVPRAVRAYETGLEFRCGRRWRFVPWGEITEVTEKRHFEGGEFLYFYHLRCADGRRLFLNSTLSDIGQLGQFLMASRRLTRRNPEG